jgi:LPXTG-motif cell wall-anchored protein
VLGGVLPSNFNKSASANKVGQDSRVDSTPTGVPGVDLPILNMGIGRLRAAIPTANNVLASGTLAEVSAGLNGLLAVLPDAVKQALQDAIANINGVIDQVNSASGTLGTALDTVGDTLATTPVNSTLGGVLNQAGLGDALGNPTEMVTQLQQLVQIPHVDDLLNGVAAKVTGLVNTAAAEKTTGKAFADASSRIASINVLDLLKVGVVDLKSHSEVRGVPGSAKNTSQCSIANVNLADTAGVSLDGKSLIVAGLPVPVPAVDVAAVKNAVNQVLNVAGLSVGLCDVANSRAAANGTSASQTLSALRIVFAPLASGTPDVANPLGITQGTQLVKIIIDPSVETAANAQVASAGPAAKAPALPHTGAGALATIVTGIMVAGGALVLRRRLA